MENTKQIVFGVMIALFVISLIGVVSANDETIYVSACRELNQEGATYILTNDIIGVDGTCFRITANSITLNGNGHTIKGNGIGEGIYAEGTQGHLISNLEISNFMNAAKLLYVKDSKFDNIKASFSGSHGIYFDRNSMNNKVVNSKIFWNEGYGVLFDGESIFNQVYYNTIEFNAKEGVFSTAYWAEANSYSSNEFSNNGIERSSASVPSLVTITSSNENRADPVKVDSDMAQIGSDPLRERQSNSRSASRNKAEKSSNSKTIIYTVNPVQNKPAAVASSSRAPIVLNARNENKKTVSLGNRPVLAIKPSSIKLN